MGARGAREGARRVIADHLEDEVWDVSQAALEELGTLGEHAKEYAWAMAARLEDEERDEVGGIEGAPRYYFR